MLYKSETSNSGNSPNGDWGDPTRLYDDVEQYHQWMPSKKIVTETEMTS